uniref:Uncharacterized protein n=1 Tax=Trichuris muris TaxID=70415 RepID=A0A5S6Q3J8_TRIMR
MDIVEGESREADLATFENVFKEILVCTVHNDAFEEPATYPRGISKTSRTCVCYEDEMQTDVQSEEPSFRPHTHEETLTVEPREDVMPKGSGPQRTDALETHALVFLTF